MATSYSTIAADVEAEPLVNNAILFIDVLEGELTKPVPPAIEPERLSRYARVTLESRSGEGAQALGWYAYNSCQFETALDWFHRASAWLPKEATVGLLAGTSTTSLAFVIAETFPDGTKSAAAMGTIFNGVTCMCIFPPLLAVTGLAATPAIVRGLALGSAGHISVMVALAAAGEIAAADAAAIVFVVLGTARCILLQIPGVTDLLVPPLPPRTLEGTVPRLT